MDTSTKLPPVELWKSVPAELAVGLEPVDIAPSRGIIGGARTAVPAQEAVFTGPGVLASAAYLRNKIAANEGLTPDDMILATRVGVVVPPHIPRIPAPAGPRAPTLG